MNKKITEHTKAGKYGMYKNPPEGREGEVYFFTSVIRKAGLIWNETRGCWDSMDRVNFL